MRVRFDIQVLMRFFCLVCRTSTIMLRFSFMLGTFKVGNTGNNFLKTFYRRFPDTSPTNISPTDSSPTDTFPTDISPTKHIPDGHFPDGHFPYQTHPRWTLLRPDKSPTDISPTRQIPDRRFSDQTNARQIFAWVDAFHNGHFPDRLNTSNNLKYLKKIYSQTTLEIYMLQLELQRYSQK